MGLNLGMTARGRLKTSLYPFYKDKNMNLETKIPPPAVCFICALLMYTSAQVSALAGMLPRFPILLSVVLIAFGTALGVLGVWAFRRVRTTVSPFNPEQTEHFVSDGVYRFSRNPMYAGLGCWLVAWAGYLAHPLPWLFLAAFVAYMTRFQIMPEERVLEQKFGAKYESYCRRVRRWL